MPETLRNPLYHWTHMELKRPFGIDTPARARPPRARSSTAATSSCAEDAFTTMGLLEQFRVAVVCTTDDPADSLEHHAALGRRARIPATRVYPTWRPDKALAVDDPAAWNAWVDALEAAAEPSVSQLRLVPAGPGVAAHGLPRARAAAPPITASSRSTPSSPEATPTSRRPSTRCARGSTVEPADARRRYKSALLHRLALIDHARGWVQQFHLGALRNNNTRLRERLGSDTGFDSIGDFEQARGLGRFLDRLDETRPAREDDPLQPEPAATTSSSRPWSATSRTARVPGKMQYGSSWWFLDQLDGMEAQMNALSNMGLLSRFVGMITDSRSFLSYSRHEYFRRLLCNLLGDDVRRGPRARRPRPPGTSRAQRLLLQRAGLLWLPDGLGRGRGRVSTTRRELLAALAGLAAAGPRRALAARGAPASAKPFSPRVGYAAITWNGNDRQAIADIAAVGFHGIQLRASVLQEFEEKPAELRRLLDEARDQALVLFQRERRCRHRRSGREYVETHTRHAKFVAALGGPFLQLISNRPKDRAPTA